MSRFNIIWRNAAYYVSIPEYNGGEVVTADEYDALTARIAELEKDKAGYEKVLEVARRVVRHKVNPSTGGRLILEVDINVLEAAIDAVDAAIDQNAQSTEEQPRYANLSCRCAISFDCPEHPWKTAQPETK